ncbi:Neurogenic locus Notch protein [Gryllus bimaculatus]|nr:Neurogenic locus Notch protein [Gryllus bimaculatus]
MWTFNESSAWPSRVGEVVSPLYCPRKKISRKQVCVAYLSWVGSGRRYSLLCFVCSGRHGGLGQIVKNIFKMTNSGIKSNMGLFRSICFILFILVPGGRTIFREGYFNGSSHVVLQTSVNLFGHTGLSFRTCSGGELFSQEIGRNELSLNVEASGNLKLTANLESGHNFETRIPAFLVNSMWYTVNLMYHLGTLTLTVANYSEIVANSTYNSELLTNAGVFSNASVLYVGRTFVGCILEGPGIIFNSSQTSSLNVDWGPCPLTQRNCPPCQQNGSSPCKNGGECVENAMGNYSCVCNPLFTGKNCETEIGLSPCETSPCMNGGTCIPLDESYQCICEPGFTGGTCGINIDECQSIPCQNGGTCQDQVNNYTCQCLGTGYGGRNCEQNINECDDFPCIHGRCFDTYGGYTCQCDLGYAGNNCDEEVDECTSMPCRNNGLCSALPGTYSCQCLAGFTGKDCETVVTNCEDMICPSGTACSINQGIAQCVCEGGLNCSAPITCNSNTCKNGGTCSNGPEGYVCICPPGYTDKNCEISTESCIMMSCKNGGTCMPNGECACPPGFTGPMCHLPLQCSDYPCINASNCFDDFDSGSYTCICNPGWMGHNCDTRCCADVGDCVEGSILCDCGTGPQCQVSRNFCVPDPCRNGGICQKQSGGYTCICDQGFTGKNCDSELNACSSAPCQHNGQCVPLENVNASSGSFKCQCAPDYTGRLCETSITTCANITCPTPKRCIDLANGPECQCPSGFTGPMCREKVVGSCPNELCNNGICSGTLDDYQCFCKPGFSGDHCTIDIDECLSMPCKNNATCLNQINGYNCTCTIGFTGRNCDDNINECENEPCEGGSTCIDLIGSYRCVCLPGLTGDNCQINIDDCESAPCQNHGICNDGINSFQCNCTNTGFDGDFCERNVDDCASNPCFHGATCVDMINNYTCQCNPGYEGRNCEIDIPECDSSPCQNGGTCQEYSKLYAENPEWNFQNASGFTCSCLEGTTGDRCSENIDECNSNPCLHGKCEDKLNAFFCVCEEGYEGEQCEIPINECERYEPCGSHGNCTDLEPGYTCNCDPKYGGQNCSVELTGCRDHPCHNNGTCTPYLEDESQHKFNCSCSKGFHGDTCQTITTISLTESSRMEIQTEREEGYDIQFIFKTTLPNCLLASGRGLTYYTLELLGGRLNLQTSLLLNKWEGVFIGADLNNGSWQRAFLQINTTHVVLAADQEQTIHPILPTETTNTSYTSFNQTFIGYTAFQELRSIVRSPTVFVGCMEDLVINGQWITPIDIPQTDIIENVSTGCQREPQCHPNPCNSGGICTDKWIDFSCACVRPFLGHKCQYRATEGIVEVTLTNTSRVAVNSVMDISMFVRTRMEKGAIFYMTSNSPQETVIAAQVESGQLSVYILLNRSLEYYVVSGVHLANGQSHLIQIIRNVTLMQVKINGTEFFRKTITASGAIDVQKLYLGGFPQHAHNKKNKRQASETSQNNVMCDVCYFKGVIQDVQVTNGTRTMVVEFFPLTVPDLTIPPKFGEVYFDENAVLKGVVSDDTCRVNPCIHEGICEVTWNDFECKCKRGYKGKRCEEMEFCQLQDCPDGSSCRNLENGYECVANVTFNGNNNSLHYTLNNFYDGSSSYMNNITLTYRSKFGGTLLYITSSNSVEEFFSISVQKDEITVSWRLYVGDKQLTEYFKKDEPDGEWTIVVFKMENDQLIGGFQDADGHLNQKININFSLDAWNTLVQGGHAYIGGLFSTSPIQHSTDGLGVLTVNTVTESVFATPRTHYTYETSLIDRPFSDISTNFKGCIGETRIGNILLSFLTQAQLTRSNLTNKHQFSLTDPDSSSTLELGCLLCFDTECHSGGKCSNATQLYTCDCPEGYTGDYCEININECENNTCQNNATCLDGINNYTCQCAPGYTGDMCEIDINECESSPCQNQGTCVNQVSYFECECLEEFTGPKCEFPRELTCANLPCKKGSTCKDVKNPKTGDNFTCICAEGFEGPRCDQAYCSITPCEHGMCNDTLEVPLCQCFLGYEGRFCETNINECASNPCHKGKCLDGINTYWCNCSGTGYEGVSCEKDIDECSLLENINQCGPNGYCVNYPGGYMCNCTDETVCGNTCGLRNPCLDEPCLNDGHCIPKCTVVPDYECDCTGTGHTGVNCTQVEAAKGSSPMDIAVIVAPIVAIFCLFMGIGITIFISMARKKRATRGTYSPSQQEYCNPRVELDNVMKPPPEERLI